MAIRKLYSHPYAQCTVEELEIVGGPQVYVREDEEDGDHVNIYWLISYKTPVMRVFVNHTKDTVWVSCPLTYSKTTRRQISWFISEMREILINEFPEVDGWSYQSFKETVIGESEPVRIISKTR